MRKYQQLTLLLLTVLSVSILVMYKRENAKLKYVLDVVNFFGRNDADAILKLENDTVQSANVYDLGYPMASWQWIGNNFHAYSAFWKQGSSLGGGEITTLVVGMPNIAVNFKCFVRFADKGKMKGRFSFARIYENLSKDFKFYKFYCKYDGNMRKVVAVTLTNVETKQEHTLLTRDLQNKQIREKIPLTVCLDLSGYNENFDSFANIINVQQFFYHYHILGATEFIVYGTKGMTTFLKNHLLRHGIQPNVFPYNFPFDETTQKPNRAIITLDCLLRTSNIAQYAVIAGINEYLYPFAARFKPNTDFYAFLELYDDNKNGFAQFQVPTRQICISPHNKIILADNNMSELLPKDSEKFYLYRPQYENDVVNDEHNGNDDKNDVKTIKLDENRISLNRYANCTDTANVFDWRHKIDENSLRYIDTISKELNLYLMQ